MSVETYMQAAIAEARAAIGRTHPNPAVGAVIVHDRQIVARGHTQAVGGNHAEIEALQEFTAKGLQPGDGTTLVVTLEPCSTAGRTGPCTEAIINSGIRQVVVGSIDPNPDHSGRGLEVLREAGIEVTDGVLERECIDLNLIFNWQMTSRSTFMAGKVATTIDGRIATRGGLSKWITGPEARADVHHWRRYFPAIAVGAGTILADNPSLTARIEGEEIWCPIRFIFDRNLITFKETAYQVYTDQWKDRTIVVTSSNHKEKVRALEDAYGIRFFQAGDEIDESGLEGFCRFCEEEGIGGVFIEGGASLISSFIKYRKLHYLYAYRGPRILADTSGLSPFMGQEPVSIKDAISLKDVRHATFADDQLMRGFIVYPETGSQ
ncbi:MAG: bifunctional diaminohydroxyphosphoribosylaminopyrimidine deaminase/5-amino-6-(5-phosphoribosylamino)uracil reductase RibD [Puniceicoccaceae bacterium]